MNALDQGRRIALAFPETSERISHGAPCFFVREKKTFVYFHDEEWGHPDHEGAGRLRLWCPAPPGVQDEMVGSEPERFFKPPYLGASGWLGVYLDRDVDWSEVEAIITEAFCKVAPKSLHPK